MSVRRFLMLFLLFVSLVAAESQEKLYYLALKAEEAGDYSRALSLFEAALKEGGEYTAEIQEIVDDYHEILESSDGDSLAVPQSLWEFHTYGNASFRGLHYDARGVSGSELGGEASSSISGSVEYSSENWIHSLDATVSGEWFFDKDDMPSLDTSAWEAALGLEYSLVGNSLVLNVGMDMNVSESDGWAPDFFAWAEKFFAITDNHKFGAALFAYENLDGPMVATAYGSWHRYVKYGWRSTVYLGGRFEADSISYSYWLKWLGPSLKPSFSYRFKTDVSIDVKMDLFYGFVVDGPDSQYEKVQKFSGSWGAKVSWNPGVLTLFVGVDQFYRFYVVPKRYTIGYPKWSALAELTAGVKWEI